MEACPLDSRRGVTEVFIKRVAVMFATMCVLGHLNSLRGMKGSSQLPLSILMFFMNPVYPLCVLIFDIGWAILKARKDARAEYTTIGSTPGAGPTDFYIAAAIGMHASYNESGGFGISGRSEESSMSILHLIHSVTSLEKTKDGPGIKKAGRLIVLAAIGVQCSATFLLGIRREQHDAATPSDRWYYLYAISGLALLAQTVVAQLLSRTYSITKNFEVHKVSESGWSVHVEVLHYLASLVGITLFCGDFVLPMERLLIALFSTNPIFWPWRIFFQHVLDHWYGLRLESLRSLGSFFFVLFLALALPLTCIAFAVGVFVWLSYNPYSDDLPYWPYPVPTNVSCPFLWEDPLANTLWAF